MAASRKHAHLTEEELAEFREIFNLVDLDKGGTISKDELKQLMTTLGLKPSQVGRALSSARRTPLAVTHPSSHARPWGVLALRVPFEAALSLTCGTPQISGGAQRDGRRDRRRR